MKQLAADETLSEEARESAKKALEVLVSSELVEIEQAAARRKRAGELKELESESQFALHKLKAEDAAEAETIDQKALAASEKQDQEILAASQKEMQEWLRGRRLQDYAADVTRIAGGCVCLSAFDWRISPCWPDLPGCLQERRAERSAVPDRRKRRRDRCVAASSPACPAADSCPLHQQALR